MKLLYTLTSITLLSLSSIGSAHCGTCDKGKSKCDKEACDKATLSENSASYAVTGMTCKGCSKKVKTALASTEGVTLKKVCHKSGCVVVEFDAAKTDKTKIQAAINKTGFKVTGEKLSIPVTGMTCKGCSKKLTTALTGIEGCTVGTVCHKSGHAQVTIDSTKTSIEKVQKVINSTGYKVKPAAKKATETSKAKKG